MVLKNNIDVPQSQIEEAFNTQARHRLATLFNHKGAQREHKKKTRRTSINCGWDFTKLKAGEKIWHEPPPVVTELYARVKISLEAATHGLMLPDSFGNAIISRYSKGDKLQPHVDLNRALAEKKGLKGYFGEQIIGVSITADKTGNLFFSSPEGDIHLQESDGLCFVLQEDFRHTYPHGITEVSQDRLSVTFRTVEFF